MPNMNKEMSLSDARCGLPSPKSVTVKALLDEQRSITVLGMLTSQYMYLCLYVFMYTY